MRNTVEHRLKSLPLVEPSPGLAARVLAAQQRELARTRRLQAIRYGGLALAASVVMAVAMLTLGSRTAGPVDEGLVALHRQSDELESFLRGFDTESRVVDMRTADTIVNLEDAIAAVDQSLHLSDIDGHERQRLWQERVGLMRALASVHMAHVAEIEF